MMIHAPLTSPLGDVVAAMFDEAERYATDAHEVRELATEALAHTSGRRFRRRRG